MSRELQMDSELGEADFQKISSLKLIIMLNLTLLHLLEIQGVRSHL